MADLKISQLDTLATSSLASGDWAVVVDVSDTSMAASGTTKKINAGNLAAIDKANTFTALQTFSAGISFGDETLNVYDEGTWTPVLTLTTPGNSSITYTVQNGTYVRIGRLVWALAVVVINTFTLGTGSGDVQISLPFAVSSSADGWGAAFLSGPAFSATPNAIVSQARAGTTLGRWIGLRDNSTPMALQASGLSSGDDLRLNIVYMAA